MTTRDIVKRYIESELATLDQEIDEINRMEDPYWNTVSEVRYNTLTDVLSVLKESEPKREKKNRDRKTVPLLSQIPMFDLDGDRRRGVRNSRV